MIDAHRGAFEYDWRTRFHRPLTVLGRSMSWGEGIRLTQRLATDPSSHVGAELSEWDHPMPREALVLMDLYDLQHASKSKKMPKPYPRPWRDRNKSRPRPTVSQDVVIAALREAGHMGEIPTR